MIKYSTVKVRIGPTVACDAERFNIYCLYKHILDDENHIYRLSIHLTLKTLSGGWI